MKLDRQLHARQALELAQTQLAAGQLDDALASARESVRLDPSQPAAHLCEARIHLERRDPLGARAALASLDRHDLYEPQRRDQPEIAALRASALTLAGDHALARPLLERLIREFPDDTRAYELLAGTAINDGKLSEAAKHLRHVLRLRPNDLSARLALAHAMESDDPAGAALVLDAISAPQRGPAIDLWLARLYHRGGRQRDALDLYARLLTQETADPSLWREAGQAADEAGAADLAESRLKQAVKLERDGHGHALEALATAHLHAGRFATASRSFWRLARQRDGDLRGWAGLTVCALASRRLGLAHRTRRALAPHTSRGERQQALAEFWRHAAAGQALLRARAAGQPAPSDAGSPLRGLLLRSSATLRAQAHRHPARADSHYHLARCHQALGELAEARESVRSALAVNPRYAAATALEAELEAAMGRTSPSKDAASVDRKAA
ncbi:MAG: tetratricopeptide repeat protein [Planctomycetota bacterium]|nr:tetratricopeptide repeat protein [Planctomycetota bacterium]